MMITDNTITTTTTTTTTNMSTYLITAFVPRGLQHVVCDMIQQEFQLSKSIVVITMIREIGEDRMYHPTTTTTIKNNDNDDMNTVHSIKRNYNNNDASSSSSSSSSFVTKVRKKLHDHLHHQDESMKQSRHRGRPQRQQQQQNLIQNVQQQEKKSEYNNNNNTTTTISSTDLMSTTTTSKNIYNIGCTTLVGTIEYIPNYHVSIGYDTTTTKTTAADEINDETATTTTTTNNTTMINDQIWSTSGQMSGIVWIEITFQCLYPIAVIPNHIRFLGPIVALVAYYDNNTIINLHHHQSVVDAGNMIQSVIQNDPCYIQKFHNAILIWRQHVQECWFDVIDHNQQQNSSALRQRIREICYNNFTTPLKYRISCLRNDSKKYIYTRRELLQHLDDIIPSHIPLYDTYTVDLIHYDFEIVLFYRHHCFMIGITLRPYQYVGSGKSFASGDLPPDIALPILTSSLSCSTQSIPRVVRLRPSTSQILLHLACLQHGDIVFDPCAGVGTIPIETQIQYRNTAFAIGGDLALKDPSFQSVTVEYLRRTCTMIHFRDHIRDVTNNKSHAPIPDILVWDATHLPIRSASIDVIVTDLPFGQLCMSAVKLDAFLPLVMTEMARVLRPSTGRMVLLCGSYISIIRTLIYTNECLLSHPNEAIWELPCIAVFPVNIGGNLAWVVVVRRSCGQPKIIPDQRNKIRNQVHKREHTEKMMLGGSKLSKMKHPQS